MVTKDYSKSRMRENRTYGSVRGGQSNLIPSTRLTAAMPLRVVEGAYELIEGASLYKTFTTGHSPVGKPYNRPAGVGNAPLLVAGATTFPPAGGLYSSLCVE